MTSTIVASFAAEFRRYKALGDSALAQLDDSELAVPGPNGGNSAAVLVWHIGGNLASRFTDFLTSDGEKPSRQREEEFRRRAITKQELLDCWQGGWAVLLDTLGKLSDADLDRLVTIRGQSLRVTEALHRSLAHASYHVGQIIYQARGLKGADWRWLSIPPGQSEQYNTRPTMEKAAAHHERLRHS